jgi:molybdopterin synthase catalytic subunit
VAELTHESIDVAALLSAAARPTCGAVNLFLGTTRDHHDGRRVVRLEYEAYERMALDMLGALEDAARERFGLAHCAIVHRLGVVPVSEASVAVVASAAHRAAAFDAARWVMDELKRRAPIWKKEHFAEGDPAWVKGHPLS